MAESTCPAHSFGESFSNDSLRRQSYCFPGDRSSDWQALASAFAQQMRLHYCHPRTMLYVPMLVCFLVQVGLAKLQSRRRWQFGYYCFYCLAGLAVLVAPALETLGTTFFHVFSAICLAGSCFFVIIIFIFGIDNLAPKSIARHQRPRVYYCYCTLVAALAMASLLICVAACQRDVVATVWKSTSSRLLLRCIKMIWFDIGPLIRDIYHITATLCKATMSRILPLCAALYSASNALVGGSCTALRYQLRFLGWILQSLLLLWRKVRAILLVPVRIIIMPFFRTAVYPLVALSRLWKPMKIFFYFNSVAALLGVVYGFFIFSVAHYCLRISKPRHNASA